LLVVALVVGLVLGLIAWFSVWHVHQHSRCCALPYQAWHHLALPSSLAPFPGCSIKASRRHQVQNQSIVLPSGATLKHRAASHQAQNPSIAPPSGGTLMHRNASHQVQNPSIVLPSGVTLEHRAAIRHKIKALRRHQAQN
jgi:hypothetical protein